MCKRAALSGGSRSGAGAVTSERSAGGRAARCSRAMRGPRTQRKVKSGICDTIAAQRCQAARSQAWEWGKRAAQPGGSRSGVEAWGKRAAARPGERARCGRAMHGPCPPRKGKVCHSRHDCGAHGRVRGRGAVCRCAGLVPHERVKSVIRDTIAARCSRAMRRPRTQRKGKVRHPRGDCRAALSGGSQSGAGGGASERRRGWMSGRGAVRRRRRAGLVPHERVKSVIRDTIAARRCQAVRSRVRERGKRAAARLDERAWCCQAQAARGPRTQRKVKSVICDTIAAQRCQAARGQAWIGGKRAAQPGGSRSSVGAGASERRVGGRAAWCGWAMRGPRTQRKGKVHHPRHDCRAALSGGSQSGAGAGQASGAVRRFAVRRGSVGQASGARADERAWCCQAMCGFVRSDAVRR